MKTITWVAIALLVAGAAVVSYRMAHDDTPCSGDDAAYCAGAKMRRAIVGGPGPNLQQCLDTYAKPALTEIGARAAIAACNRLKNTPSAAATKWARCVLSTVPGAGNEIGVRLALRDCNTQ